MLHMRAYGASISDVIDDITWLWHHTRKVTIFKNVAFETRTRIDYPYGQTLLSVSVTEVITCVIFLLTWLSLVYTWHEKS